MMIFAKVGVDVYSHPRFMKAGFEASGYWMHALAYLRHHESSDGFLACDLYLRRLFSDGSICFDRRRRANAALCRGAACA